MRIRAVREMALNFLAFQIASFSSGPTDRLSHAAAAAAVLMNS